MPNCTVWICCLTCASTEEISRPSSPLTAPGKNTFRVPKSYKSYSSLADQFGKNAHSTPAPTVQPVRVSLAAKVPASCHATGSEDTTVELMLYLSWAQAMPPFT